MELLKSVCFIEEIFKIVIDNDKSLNQSREKFTTFAINLRHRSFQGFSSKIDVYYSHQAVFWQGGE
jgi:hypothetical protein